MLPLRRAHTIFEVGGIPIRLHASWLIVFALVATTLASAIPAEVREAGVDLAPAARWALGIATALAFFGSILLHELGHAALAIRNGLEIRGITLFIFGGVAELRREPRSPRVELEVAVAGPAVSLVLALLFAGLTVAARAARPLGGDAAVAVGKGLEFLAAANLALIVFNAFPGFPLDGGRVLRAVVWWWTGSMRRATRVTTAIGELFGLALCALAAAQVFLWKGPLFHAAWLALIGLFVRRAARASYENAVILSGLEGLEVRDVMRQADSPPPAFPRRAPEPRVAPTTAALAALEAMRDGAYLHVFEGDLFRGLVTRGDILRAAALRARA